VWLAMLAGSLPLLAYLPLIRNNIAEFAPHAWNRPQISMIGWSYLELVEGVFWPVLGLGLWVWWRGKISTEGTKVTQRKAEMAAVGVLLVYPVIGFAVAVGGAGMISPRCVVPVCCGFGMSGGVLAQRVFGRSARVGMAIVLLMVVWVGVRQGICANLLLEQRQAFFALRNDVKQTQVGQILVADSSFALPLHYYSDRDVRRLSWFPIDFEAIHQYERDDSGEQNLWAGRDGIFWQRIVPLADVPLFRGGSGGSSVVESPCFSDLSVIARPDGWLASKMKERGFSLAVIGDISDWERVGGEFTPMAHFDTRIMRAHAPCVPN
jgi:hypothetical protein